MIIIENENIRVYIDSDIGGSIYSIEYKIENEFVEITRKTGSREKPFSHASFNMVPFSGRIEFGMLSYNDKTYYLEKNDNGINAIHGIVFDKKFQIEKCDKTSTKLSYSYDGKGSWPFAFDFFVDYAIEESTFLVSYTLINTDNQKAPAGFGMHPYFKKRLKDNIKPASLTAPMKGIYPGGTVPKQGYVELENNMDFSFGRNMDLVVVDDCFRSHMKKYTIEWKEIELDINYSDIFKNLVIYSPENGDFFCVEPATNCNNGFNIASSGIVDTGTVYLEKDEKIQGTITFEFTRKNEDNV